MKRYCLFYVLLFLYNVCISQQPKLVEPVGHTSALNYAAYSPDGKYVITASHNEDDRTARVWEVESGKLLFNLNKHFKGIKRVAYNAAGKYILTLSAVPVLWDAATGEMAAVIDSVETNDAVFSPDGKYVAFASQRFDSMLIWDIEQKKPVKSIGGRMIFQHLLFSPDGKKIATFSNEYATDSDSSMIRLWDVDSGKELLNYKAGNWQLNDMAFSGDGKLLVFSTDNEVQMLNTETKKEVSAFDFQRDRIVKTYFTKDNKFLLLTDGGYSIHVISLDSNKLVHSLSGHSFHVSGLTMLDENRLVSTSWDSTFKVWDIKEGKELYSYKAHDAYIEGALTSPDNKNFITFGDDNKAKLWKSNDYSLTKTLKGFTSNFSLLIITPDSSRVISIDESNSIKVMDIKTGKLEKVLNGHTGNIIFAEVSVDGQKLLTNSLDSTLRIWDLTTGKELINISGGDNYFEYASLNPDGKSFCTLEWGGKLSTRDITTGKTKASQPLSQDGMFGALKYSADGKFICLNSKGDIEIREANTVRLVKKLIGSKNLVTDISISPDKKILTAVADSMIHAWDFATGRKLYSTKSVKPAYNRMPYATRMTTVNFSPDSKRIITGAEDYTAKIFDVKTGKQIMMLDSAHFMRLSSAQYSKDGKKIITTSKDNYTIIWSAEDGTPLFVLGDFSEQLNGVDINPNGKTMVTSANSNLYLWNLDNGNLLYKTLWINNNDWLNVDSSLRYDGTGAARKLLYIACGNEIVDLEQVKDKLWVPGLAERIMKGETINSSKLSELNICNLTPLVERKDGGKDSYRFQITPRNGGLGETIVFVNNIEINRYKKEQLSKTGDKYELLITNKELEPYFIPGTDNPVAVKSMTAANDISSRSTIVEDAAAGVPANKTAPNLYAVVAGVSDYKGNELDLRYAAKDANDIANVIENCAGKLLNTDGKKHVFVYKLHTAEGRDKFPEKNNIKETLQEIGAKAQPNDILLIFFAGHGKWDKDKNQFFFLTADASKETVTSAIADVGISTQELTDWIQPAKMKAQKRILVFDACNSGQAIKDLVKIGNDDQKYLAARDDEKAEQIKAVEKLNNKSGLFILSASASNQYAYEMGRYSQGLLTYSLLKAIKEQPEVLDDRKYLSVYRWFDAAEKTVSAVAAQSGNQQQPQLVSTTNFAIGVVDDEVRNKINLPGEKPVFAASNFQNSDEDIAADNLGMNKLVDNILTDISTRAIDSKISYLPYSAADAYNLSGRYTVTGNTVLLKVNIRKNNQTQFKFEITGATDKPEVIAQNLTTKVLEWLSAKK